MEAFRQCRIKFAKTMILMKEVSLALLHVCIGQIDKNLSLISTELETIEMMPICTCT
jgi:hypothetical protein